MPTARIGLVAVAVNGRIYAIGGSTATALVTSVEEYDPPTDTWKIRSPMPEPVDTFGEAGVVGGKVYLLPTYQGSGFTSSLYVYDPASDSWATGSNYIPVPNAGYGAGAVGGKVYMVGGTALVTCATQMVQAYSPSSDSWEFRSPMPTWSDEMRVTVLNGILFAIGGMNWGSTCMSLVTSQDVVAYDPMADSWTQKTNLPCGQRGPGVCAVNGRVYAIGGLCQWGTCPVKDELPVVHEYDATADSWVTKTSLPVTTYMPGAVAIGCTIYVLGGWTGPSFTYVSASVYAGCLANCPPSSPPPPASAPLPLEVYPNPFVPEQAIRGTLKFQGVPAGARVRIYTSSGLKAWEATGTGGVLEWDGKNQAGRPVAPGVYQWVIESAGVRTRGKVVVER